MLDYYSLDVIALQGGTTLNQINGTQQTSFQANYTFQPTEAVYLIVRSQNETSEFKMSVLKLSNILSISSTDVSNTTEVSANITSNNTSEVITSKSSLNITPVTESLLPNQTKVVNGNSNLATILKVCAYVSVGIALFALLLAVIFAIIRFMSHRSAKIAYDV